MNNNLGDVLNNKARQLKGRQSNLQRVQAYLDEQFGKDTCTAVLQKNQLVIQASSSAAANQLWQRQTAVLTDIQQMAPDIAPSELRIKPR